MARAVFGRVDGSQLLAFGGGPDVRVAAAGSASFMEITGKTATEVVKGLSGSPMLLALLVLNGVGITAAVWYILGKD